MFTGIVEEVGEVASLRSEGNVARLALRARLVLDDLKPGDSLATNGVCLTVERREGGVVHTTAMPETLKRTTLGGMRPGARVNLERALRVDGRLGGHIVTGHVDEVGELRAVTGTGEERVLTFSLPSSISRFVATKGSIAVDGVSLTVVEAGRETFSVSLVRHTVGETTLGDIRPGAKVNLEVDVLARYLDRLSSGAGGDLSLERLGELGY